MELWNDGRKRMLRVAGYEFKVNKSKLEHQGRLVNGQFFALKAGKGFCGGGRPGSEGMI